MDKETVINILRNYSEAIKAFLPVKEIVLYGSFAKGNQKEFSDIDVAVIVENFNGNYLETSFILNKLSRKFSLRIEPLLIDPSKDRAGFLEEIRNTGILIYQAS
jgi:uncharacterized protein